MADYIKRIEKLEGGDRPKRNISLHVQYFKTETDPDGGQGEIPIEAKYDETPFDWEKVSPLPNGDKIHVLFPRSENLDEESKKPG